MGIRERRIWGLIDDKWRPVSVRGTDAIRAWSVEVTQLFGI